MSLELMSFGESAKGQTDSIQVYRESVHSWECAGSYSPLWSLQNCTESGSQPCFQTSAPWGSWGGLGWAGALYLSGLYKYHFLRNHEKKKVDASCFKGIKFLHP